jgi:hypothetical protein
VHFNCHGPACRLAVLASAVILPAVLCAQVAAPPPILNSVTTSRIPQNSQHLRLTLLGSEFRPGAMVLISGTLQDGIVVQPQAEDVRVETVLYVNGNTLIATVSARADAAEGTRMVNVVNSDGSNTGVDIDFPISDTPKPVEVIRATSLSSPLQAQTLAITHPRDGTAVGQGDQLFAEAIVGGVGSGTITGEWILDRNISEQFSLVMTGGQAVRLRTSKSLPTLLLGVHHLELRITSPNLLQSRTITLVVNPSGWSLQRLLGPHSRASYLNDTPPLLRWAIVPGAAKYQVGFATRPYLSAVQHWHDIHDTEWQVPKDIWLALPEGELYWTVRVVETSGDVRQPPPMRRIERLPAGVLQPLSITPHLTRNGVPLLAWHGINQPALYRVTISRDAEGSDIVRRYFTKSPHVDLWAVLPELEAGHTYFWRVEALSTNGEPLIAAPTYQFVAGVGDKTGAFRKPNQLEVASLGVGFAAPPPADLVEVRVPGPGETVRERQPEIRLQLKNPVVAGLTAVMVDGTDVTGVAEFTTDTISVKLPTQLSNGVHKITLQVDQDMQEWSFNVDAPAPPSNPSKQTASGPPTYEPGTDAEAEPVVATTSPTPKTAEAPQAIGPVTDFDAQISTTTQWISGNDPGEEETNVTSVASRMGYENEPLHFEENGSGLLNSTFAPEPRHALGRFNDSVFRLSVKSKPWGGELRFGTLAPSLYSNSEFVTTATPRQGVEPVLKTPAGDFGFYANTSDAALGGGNGVAFHQQILGAGYKAPLLEKYATFRLMWLYAGDHGAPTTISFTPGGTPIQGSTPLAAPGRGDAYGGFLHIQLAPGWNWDSEYAWSYNNPDVTVVKPARFFGRAWRSGVNGAFGGTSLNVAFHNVSRDFASPANPTLSVGSSPNRRQVDAEVAQTSRIGTFNFSYQLMQSDVSSVDHPTLTLNNGMVSWDKDLGPTTIVGLNGHFMRTTSGELPPAALTLPASQQQALKADLRDGGIGGNFTRRVGAASLSFQATRDWYRNQTVQGANTITSALNAGLALQSASWFQLQSNVSLSWVTADPALVGTQRLITIYVQPAFLWQRSGLSVTPLFTFNNTQNQLSSGTKTIDSRNGDAGGRLSWRMPGPLHISTLAIDGSSNWVRDTVLGTDVRDSRIGLVWTLAWGFSRSNAGVVR